MTSLAPNTIKPARGSQKKSKRVGRGNASGKGTYAARGLKGQKARSGGKGGLKRLGFKQSLQKVPKLRGFNSLYPKKGVVTLATLERVCSEEEKVTPVLLAKKGVVRSSLNGVKIVASGELKKKLEIRHCIASKKAIELIEKAGGTITF
ncbi:MAG: 50S ribosomal protein L15 [Patescibacteria group bacterium]